MTLQVEIENIELIAEVIMEEMEVGYQVDLDYELISIEIGIIATLMDVQDYNVGTVINLPEIIGINPNAIELIFEVKEIRSTDNIVIVNFKGKRRAIK
ncbi:hypothetical protein [Listeria seeligeri]|uniref:hypothetical protein n=1 Tax=Listeria seeligeri TaxID=1640 RepID=UPI0022EBEA58|nr:hypothetical protein [Listeria seeligeri]